MDYIDSENLSEVQLGVKKLQLNIISNSIFAKNLLAYTEQRLSKPRRVPILNENYGFDKECSRSGSKILSNPHAKSLLHNKYLNINYIRNKFYFPFHQVKVLLTFWCYQKLNLMIVSQKDSLTEAKMGVVLLYIPEDIPAELLCSNFLIEMVYIEINLHNKKRLINYFYNLHNDNTLRQNYSSRGF